MKIKNVGWNLFGMLMPLALAIFTIPLLLRLIGEERFGILTLVWGLAAYVGMFDLGIGRATTQYVAKLRGTSERKNIYLVIQIARKLALLSGLGGAVLFLLLVFSGAYKAINFSPNLESEIFYTGILIAVLIPLQALAAMYRGINEAFEDFKLISIIKIFVGIINFIGPLLVAYITRNLAFLVVTIVISRCIGLFAFSFAARKHINLYKNEIIANKIEEKNRIKKYLLNFGGWFTLSSFVGPILVQSDRFLIAGVLTASAVASYTIPYEVVIQSLILVVAISHVAFPNLALELHNNRKNALLLFNKWTKLIVFAMAGLCTALGLLLPLILPLWIGEYLPDNSIEVGQILCLGIFINCVGLMYYTLLQAEGRSDLTAKIHVAEVPFYLLLLWFLIVNYGVIGAAIAWVCRVAIDTLLLIFFSYKIFYNKAYI